ncbi:alpha-amylase family glycosyl hydrolase [Deinococcus roseus]|uniref:Alpha-amylase n=1 Tax=Deinococcus roseus TaxID=392414 RepID=A0ABQ2DCK2_9DEIO|nr:alpha-amylase family glycosyl hydrolase [Deinococcus roseus]GGJ53654.1 alpha-amylase [Deinococcus roseus]
MKKQLVALTLLLSLTAQAEVLPPPDWLSSATVYQVFIRNHTGDGTFEAATETLQQARDLGVNTLYLLPFYPTGKIKRIGVLGSPFSIRDYQNVDPNLGSLDDFKAYLEKAHSLGLKVVIDLVLNHTSWDNKLITEHPEFYKHDASGQILPPRPEWQDVAGLDSTREDTQQHLISIGEFWANLGVDGFRADYSDGLPLAFWQKFRTHMKAINPQFLLLAETGDEAFHDRAFDLSYDWVGMSKAVAAVSGLSSANSFFNYQADQGNVPKLRYLENHDQDRIASKLKEDFQKKAVAALLLTEPGVPLIYAGQEWGIDHRPNLFDPDPVLWNQGNSDLHAFYQKLLSTRSKLPALQSGALKTISAQSRNVAAFERFTPEQKVTVLINFAAEPQTVNFKDPQNAVDQLSGKTFQGMSWVLQPGEAQILLPASQ